MTAGGYRKQDPGKQRFLKKFTAALFAAAAVTAAGIFPAAAETAGQGETAGMQAASEAETGGQQIKSAMDVICAPSGIAAAEDGSFFVTDTYNKVIWKVTDGVSVVYAGARSAEDLYGEPVGGYNDSSLDQAYFKEPWAIAPFLNGYAVSDSANNVVRLITDQSARTATGKPEAGFVNGRGIAASFDRPTGLATDGEGNLYIADTNNSCIRKVTTNGDVSTYAGGLSEPTGLCWQNGSLYVAESGANRILKITGGAAEIVAGSGQEGNQDGEAAQASFSSPQGVAVSSDGIIYVSDTGNGAVRKIQDGAVTTMIASSPQNMESYPIAPAGLLIRDGQLLVCDNFSKKVFVLER